MPALADQADSSARRESSSCVSHSFPTIPSEDRPVPCPVVQAGPRTADAATRNVAPAAGGTHKAVG